MFCIFYKLSFQTQVAGYTCIQGQITPCSPPPAASFYACLRKSMLFLMGIKSGWEKLKASPCGGRKRLQSITDLWLPKHGSIVVFEALYYLCLWIFLQGSRGIVSWDLSFYAFLFISSHRFYLLICSVYPAHSWGHQHKVYDLIFLSCLWWS